MPVTIKHSFNIEIPFNNKLQEELGFAISRAVSNVKCISDKINVCELSNIQNSADKIYFRIVYYHMPKLTFYVKVDPKTGECEPYFCHRTEYTKEWNDTHNGYSKKNIDDIKKAIANVVKEKNEIVKEWSDEVFHLNTFIGMLNQEDFAEIVRNKIWYPYSGDE